MIPISGKDAEVLRARPSADASPLGWSRLFGFAASSANIGQESLSRRPNWLATDARAPSGIYGTIDGRCMIFEDSRMRELQAEKPWGELSSAVDGPDASELRAYANTTPDLVVPQHRGNRSYKLIDALFGLIPADAANADRDLRIEISGDSYSFGPSVAEVFPAAHLYAHRWREGRNPTARTPDGLKVFECFAP